MAGPTPKADAAAALPDTSVANETVRRLYLGPQQDLTNTPEMRQRLAELGEAQCSLEEAARMLGVTLEAFETFLERPGPRRAFQGGQAHGLMRLRQAQLKMAETSAPMAVLLGKAYLGLGERRESDEEGAQGDNAGAAERLRSKLAAFLADSEGEGVL